MKKIFGLALGLALFAGGAHAQQVNQYGAAGTTAVLTETELTDVVLFTNGRAEKGIVLEVTAGQPVRIIQADGIVHAYSPLLVDRIIRGCGVEILHTAAPAANMAAAKDEPVESYDDKPDYYEELEAARTARRAPLRRSKVGTAHAAAAVTRPAARRPLRGAQPVAPHRAHAVGAARLRPARHAAEVEARPRVRAAKAGAAARTRAARGAKRR